MSISAAQVLYVLKKLKDLPDKAKAIKEVRVDDKDVTNFKITKMEIDLGTLEVELQFTPLGSESSTKLYAKHIFRSTEPDVILVDGREVADDNVELDIDMHLLRADIEYRLHYTDKGARHEVFMLASVDWFGI